MAQNYLEPVDDGLAMRSGGVYAKDKLNILRRVLYMFTTSMRGKPWVALNYIDLESGPGKNRIRESAEIVLGSPLLALTTEQAFDNYFLVEQNLGNFDSLQTRVMTHDYSRRIMLFSDDCNKAIEEIAVRIEAIDEMKDPEKWDSLSIAFVDPEGLEVEWDTIEALGKRIRCDLVINVSTSTIIRSIYSAFGSSRESAIDRFYGNRDWRAVYGNLDNRRDGAAVRRAMLDLYAKQLQNLSYKTTKPNGEYIVLNSRNRQLYCLLAASKHQLGVDFFTAAAAKFKSLPLPGFV